MAKRFRTNDDYRVDLRDIDSLTMDPVWDAMTLSDFKRYGRYVRKVADLLGLSEWTIYMRISPEIPSDEEDPLTAPLAMIRVAPESQFATIRVSQNFSSEPNKLQQQSLIHEVLHIYFEPLLHPLTETILPDLVGSPAASAATAYLNVEKERVVDALAVALAPLMPKLPKQ